MENSKTFWKDGFKEKIKKTEIDEYWLKDLDSPNESNTQQKENNKEENTKEGMDTNNYTDLKELDRIKQIQQMEMENYKHIELLQNISDLKDDVHSVIEEGYHKKKNENNSETFYEDYVDIGDTGDMGDMDNMDDMGDESGQENFTEGMKKCKSKKKTKKSKFWNNYYVNMIQKKAKYLVDLLDGGGNRLNKLYIKTSNKIANVLSGNTATKSDKKFIYNYLCYFIVLLMSIFVFMDFYFLFAIYNEEFWKEPEKYSEKKDNLNEHSEKMPLINSIFGVAISSFIFIITTFHWMISYVPLKYLSIRNHMIVPYMFLFIIHYVSGIHQGFFSFFKSFLQVDYKKISKNSLYIFVLILCIYFTGKIIVKFLIDHPNYVPTDMIRGLFFLFIVVIFFIIMMMTQPIVGYFLCGCYFLYYAFVPILFHDQGFFGNISKVYHSLTEINYEYIAELEKGKCLPGVHPCKNHDGKLSWIYDYMIEPAHVFVIRHFLTFTFSFYLWKLLFESFLYVRSFQLKMALAFISITLSILLMISGDWFTAIKITYDDGQKFFSNYYHLGLLPLIAIIFWLWYMIIK